jgi:hypothetical protein
MSGMQGLLSGGKSGGGAKGPSGLKPPGGPA